MEPIKPFIMMLMALFFGAWPLAFIFFLYWIYVLIESNL